MIILRRSNKTASVLKRNGSFVGFQCNLVFSFLPMLFFFSTIKFLLFLLLLFVFDGKRTVDTVHD